jgi:hypothetical protein
MHTSSEETIWPTLNLASNLSRALRSGFTFCYSLLSPGGNIQTVVLFFLNRTWIDIYHSGCIPEEEIMPKIEVYMNNDGREMVAEKIFTSCLDGWNRFCVEVNASRKHLKIFVNDENISRDKAIPFEAMTKQLKEIKIVGNCLLSQAEIFSDSMDNINSDMAGDLLKWSASLWGSYELYFLKLVPSLDIYQPRLVFVPSQLTFSMAVDTCKNLGNGEIAAIEGYYAQKKLLNFYKEYNISLPLIHTPYLKGKDSRNYTNFYNSNRPLPDNIDKTSGGPNRLCVECYLEFHQYYAVSCSDARSFFCNFTSTPVLKLRGLCAETLFDIYFTPTAKLGEFVWMGADSVHGAYIRYIDKQWLLKVSGSVGWASSDATFGTT